MITWEGMMFPLPAGTGTITPGVSFVINALDPAAPAGVIAADVSIVNWFLVEAL